MRRAQTPAPKGKTEGRSGEKDPLFAIRSVTLDAETSHRSEQLWEVPTLLGPVMQAWFLYSHLLRQCLIVGADLFVSDNSDWITGVQYL